MIMKKRALALAVVMFAVWSIGTALAEEPRRRWVARPEKYSRISRQAESSAALPR